MTQEKNSNLDREKIIKRIVEERGEDAIPTLIDLLEDESNEVREIAAQALQNLGDVVTDYLMKYLRSKLDEEDPFNDVSLLYVADILGELRHKESIPLLYQLLEHYDEEPYQLIIYEALAKLGEGEKFIELLIYLLKEDAFKDELKDQVLMTLAYTKNEKALKVLIDEWYNKNNFENKSLVLNAIKVLLTERPELIKILSEDKNAKRILDELKF
ncbi:MAG: HEAT repeat domain-containing protein [Thermotogae bacterium]|nr:HEAT repeat domain-containing protein [Thermotogota bacterium]